MSASANFVEECASGKSRRDENFPVASWLIAARYRPLVRTFYVVARLADDVADHPSASRAEKLAGLDAIEASITGESTCIAAARELKLALNRAGVSQRHILDLLTAFRRDVVKPRTSDWGDLMDYCRYSAAPVGRFVLDVHGEDRANWAASDALCAALQVINHLQDCGKDYRTLDRVYVPAEMLGAAGLDERALAAPAASPALRRVFADLSARTAQLLVAAAPLAVQIRDPRLALEVGVIHALALSLTRRLAEGDPLAAPLRHGAPEAVGLTLGAAAATAARRLFGRKAGPLAIEARPAA